MTRFRDIAVPGYGTFRTTSTLPTRTLRAAVLRATEIGDCPAAREYDVPPDTLRSWRRKATMGHGAKPPGGFLREQWQREAFRAIERGAPAWQAIDALMGKWAGTQNMTT